MEKAKFALQRFYNEDIITSGGGFDHTKYSHLNIDKIITDQEDGEVKVSYAEYYWNTVAGKFIGSPVQTMSLMDFKNSQPFSDPDNIKEGLYYYNESSYVYVPCLDGQHPTNQ